MFGTPIAFCCLLPAFIVALGAWWSGTAALAKHRRMPPWAVWLARLAPLIGVAWLVGPYWVLTEGLISAAREGDVSGVRWRLALGADPNEGDADGFSPLESAVAGDHADVVRLLLERGVDPDLRHADEDGFHPSARQAALEQGDPVVIALLARSPRR